MYGHFSKQNPNKKMETVFFNNVVVFRAFIQDKSNCHLILEIRPSHTAQAPLISEVKNVALYRKARNKKNACE